MRSIKVYTAFNQENMSIEKMVLKSDHDSAIASLNEKLRVAKEALEKYSACICDDGETYAARIALEQLEQE